MRKVIIVAVFSLVIASFFTFAVAKELQVIAGAGPSTKIVEKFCEIFSQQPVAKNCKFHVPQKSIKHAGGIKASDTNLFGRTGRPLNDKEKAMNKDEIILARVPIAFVVGSDVGVRKITIEQLEDIYTKKTTNWRQLGGINAPIVLVGREPTEALYSVLKTDYPFFQEVEFDKVVSKDHLMVTYLRNVTAGKRALGFGAKPNRENRHRITVEGFESGVSVGLVYDLKNKDNEIVKGAQKYARSDVWAQNLREEGLLPPN